MLASSRVHALSDLNRLILHDDTNQIVAQFVYPTTIFVKEQMFMLVSERAARSFFQRVRLRLADAGAVACMCRDISSVPLDGPRAIETSHGAFLDFEGRVVADSLIRATVSPNERGLGIDILRFIKSPLDLRLDEIVPLGAIA